MSTETRRVKLVIAYDGSDFRGYAAQPEQRTVQGTLTEAILRMCGENREITGASRTDSGAHAKGQVVHFDSPASVPVAAWKNALNRYLPNDLRVVHSEIVSEDFHCRFHADKRIYEYSILSNTEDPFQGRFAYIYGKKLNVEAMQSASEFLIGIHDFRAFTEEIGTADINTRRKIHEIQIEQSKDLLIIRIIGTAFLRGMMRKISGFLFEVGRGYRPISDVELLLQNVPVANPPVVLPANGLCLIRIEYANPPIDSRLNPGF